MEDKLYNMNEGQQKKIATLENDLDDQISRNMRTTLIFSGINGNEVKWDETANKLSEMDQDLEKDEIMKWIERTHRLTPKNDKSGKPRKIVAKFESWKQSEKVKQIIIKFNRENKDL